MLCLKRDSRQFGFAEPASASYGGDALGPWAAPAGRGGGAGRRRREDGVRYSHGGRVALAKNGEGDVTVYSCATREVRDAATDLLAFWHWAWNEETWVEGIPTVAELPEELRGADLPPRADREL